MATPVLNGLSIHHFSVSVPNMEQALAWYSEILGFTTEMRFSIDTMPARGAFLVRDSMRVELWELPGTAVPEERKEPDSDLKSGGTKHIAFSVPNLQQQLAKLVEHGVDIAAVQRDPTQPMAQDSDPCAAGKPPVFAVFIRDPAGTLLELLDHSRVTEKPA